MSKLFILILFFVCMWIYVQLVLMLYVQLVIMLYSSQCIWLAIFQNNLLTGGRSWYRTVIMGTRNEIHLGSDEILKQFGDINTLALDNIIDPSDESDEEMTLMIPSQYYTVDNLPVKWVVQETLMLLDWMLKAWMRNLTACSFCWKLLVNKISPSMSCVYKKVG